jgi:cytochrome c2
MKIIFFVIIVFLFACNNSAENNAQQTSIATNTNGENLFKSNCASCHRVAENYVGPALQGVESRWENKELLYDFVRNSQDVIGRNAYAKKLFEEYKQSPMLPYPHLKDEDIQSILDYCNAYK